MMQIINRSNMFICLIIVLIFTLISSFKYYENFTINTQKTIIINKPEINNNIITCKINFNGKKIKLKNEYHGIDNLYDGVEGFISLFIPHMFLTNDKIIVRSKICKKFYDNLLKLKAYYESLNIGPIFFNIDCNFKETKNLMNRKNIATFTGGVDSFYTLLKEVKNIDTILYCINYDVQENQKELLDQQLKTVKEIANKLNKKFIICKTNQRNVLENNINYLKNLKTMYKDLWGYFLFGPCLFSNAYNLSNDYKKIYIPSSLAKNDSNFLWGSTFYIDHLYSSSFLEISHNGDCTRVDKIKEIINLNKNLFFEYLKVCYNNEDQKYNCSKCEKCRRTYIPIGILNKNYLSQLKTFNIDLNQFEKIKNDYYKIKFNKISDKRFQDEIKNLEKNKH